MKKLSNVFQGLTADPRGEAVDVLLRAGETRIERIVSKGHRSADEFWYDQAVDEWVMLLQGSAVLRLAGPERVVRMGPGDFVHIPAHVRHRVEWTSPSEETIWLAVHFAASPDAGGVT